MTGHQVAKKRNHKKTNETKREKIEAKTVTNALEENNQQPKKRQAIKTEQKRKRLLNKLQ